MSPHESEQLAKLFDSYAPSIYRYMLRRVSDAPTRDDLVSEVFLVAAQKLGSIPSDKELPWLYGVARNVLANWRRRVSAIPMEEVPLPGQQGNDEDVSERLSLAEAWQSLSEGDREVLRLAAWEGLSGEALGEAMGMSSSGAASSLSRARAHLAKAFQA